MAEPDQREIVRILVVDDEPAMHDSYRRSFAAVADGGAAALGAMAQDLFGTDDAPPVPPPRFATSSIARLIASESIAMPLPFAP